MVYFDEIKDLVKENNKEYYQIVIKKDYFIVEGFLEVLLYQRDIFCVKIKDVLLTFRGVNFKILKSTKTEVVVKGQMVSYVLEK